MERDDVMSLEITLPDGSHMDVPEGTTVIDVAYKIGKRLANDAIAGKIDCKLVDLTTELKDDVDLEIVTFDSEEGKEIYRHTASHVMAQAVKRLFPGTKLTIGPAIEDGFYYDFDSPHTFSPEDLAKIESEMQKIIM